jgi:hypothetical protein
MGREIRSGLLTLKKIILNFSKSELYLVPQISEQYDSVDLTRE